MATDDRTIEELVVKLVADYDDFLRGVQTGVNKGEQEFDKFSGTGKKALQEVGKESKISALSIGLITTAAIAAGQALTAFASRGIAALTQLGAKAIGLRSEFEQATITFSNMLGGDQDTALAFLDQLKQKAIELKVPFSDATKFAKSILPDTKNLDQFNELFRLAAVGAKDARLPLEELIFAFNEAVSGDFVSIRDRLDIPKDVIARIKEADDTTGALVEELNKLFTKRGINDVSAFAATLDATTSSLSAFGEKLLFIASETGFETLKESAQRFLSILQENEPGLEKIAQAVGQISNSVLEFLSSGFLDNVEELDTSSVLELADSTLRTVENIQLLASTLPGVDFGELVEGANSLVSKLNEALLTATKISAMYQAEQARQAAAAKVLGDAVRKEGKEAGTEWLNNFLAGVAENGPDFIAQATLELSKAIGDEAAQKTAGAAAEAGQKAYTDSIMASFKAIDEAAKEHDALRQAREDDTNAAGQQTDATNKINEALAKNAQAASDAAEANQKLSERGGDLGLEIQELQEETNEKLQELEEDHTERMLEIDEQYNEARLDLEKKTAESLNDLAEEVADRREEINSQARDDLAQLEKDTAQQIAKERDDFNQQEKRDTEDHQRDMKRMQGDYLFDLQDAVAARDARAIVDLRRRFQKEKQEKERDFRTDQGRGRADLNERIDEIKQNEREQRDEIEASQQEQLDKLVEYEAEKRDQINESYQEQLASLQENYQEQKDTEMEHYTERKEELNKALTERLEAIAKELADEKDITEEGAKAILETLNETFGLGGDIDKLMEDFQARRRQRMTIEISVSSEIDEQSTTTPQPTRPTQQPTSSNGNRQRAGTRPGPRPMRFQEGGLVPGAIGSPVDAVVHGGEWVIPHEDVMEMIMTRQSNATGAMNHRFAVDVNMKGIPANMDQRSLENVVAGIFNRALNEAGIGK